MKVIKISSGFPHVIEKMLGNGQWGIVTSESSDLNGQWEEAGKGRINPENKVKLVELKHLLEAQGFGFTQIQGAWFDEHFNSFIDEDSLFIPNIPESVLQQIARKYSQDAYVYGKDGYYRIVSADGSHVIQQGKVFDHIHQFYKTQPKSGFSEVKGREFELEQ